jgi:7-carboxy-7-deazaguanine synthase
MPESEKRLPVSELYGPVIQGEGAICGHISYFLRMGGCPLRCAWCDSMIAVDPKQIKKNATYMTQEKIIERILHLTKHESLGQWITLSGGDPLMWDLGQVVSLLRLDEMKICVETQGSFAPYWLEFVDLITCSPKPPSSGMNDKVDFDIIKQYHSYHNRVVLKVVIFNKEDLAFAQQLKGKFPHTPLYLSAGTPTKEAVPDDRDLPKHILQRYKWLTEEVVANRNLHGAIVGAQMHALIYGHRQGV